MWNLGSFSSAFELIIRKRKSGEDLDNYAIAKMNWLSGIAPWLNWDVLFDDPGINEIADDESKLAWELRGLAYGIWIDSSSELVSSKNFLYAEDIVDCMSDDTGITKENIKSVLCGFVIDESVSVSEESVVELVEYWAKTFCWILMGSESPNQKKMCAVGLEAMKRLVEKDSSKNRR